MLPNDIIELHNKLAKRVKQFESSLNKLPPPEVLNESRYALRAVMELSQFHNDGVSVEEECYQEALRKTRHALLCAYHDLVDGLTIYIVTLLESMTSEYPVETITVMGPKKAELMSFIAEVNEAIAESRGEPRDRKHIYDEVLYDRYFEGLLDSVAYLSGALVDDILTLYKEKEAEKSVESGRFFASTTFGVLGCALGVVGIALAILYGS